MTATAISNVYGGFETFVASVLTGHKKLSNPYSLEDNPSPVLKKGYGVKIGAGQNSRRFTGGFHSTSRTFVVVLTMERAAPEGNIAACKAAELAIFEDVQSLIKAVNTNSTMAANTTNIQWTGDSGLQFVAGQSFKYLTTEISFSVEYVEAN